MPMLANKKHESFCVEVLKNKGNISKAYQAVYDPPGEFSAGVNASRLVKDNTLVKARIEELFSNSNLSLAQVITEHSKLIASAPVRVTAETKLNAIALYYKLTSMLTNDIRESNSYNSQINISMNTTEAQTLKAILAEITELNTSLQLSKQAHDSDNVIEQDSTKISNSNEL